MSNPTSFEADLSRAWSEAPVEGQDLDTLRARLNRRAGALLRSSPFRGLETPRHPWTDERLIRAAASGDPEAFAAIATEYLERLVTKAGRSVPRDIAEDLAADTLMVFMEAASEFGEPFRLAGILYGILRNQILKHYRAEGYRRRIPDLVPEPEAEISVMEAMILREDQTRLSAAIHAALSMDQEIAVVGRLAGKPDAEIADELETTASNVRTLCSRALKALTAALNAMP